MAPGLAGNQTAEAWLAETAAAFDRAQQREAAQRQTLEAGDGTTHVALLGTQVFRILRV